MYLAAHGAEVALIAIVAFYSHSRYSALEAKLMDLTRRLEAAGVDGITTGDPQEKEKIKGAIMQIKQQLENDTKSISNNFSSVKQEFERQDSIIKKLQSEITQLKRGGGGNVRRNQRVPDSMADEDSDEDTSPIRLSPSPKKVQRGGRRGRKKTTSLKNI